MEPWIFRFKAEGTVDYSQLTFDPGQNELIVGARYLISEFVYSPSLSLCPPSRLFSSVVCPFIVLSFILLFFPVFVGALHE